MKITRTANPSVCCAVCRRVQGRCLGERGAAFAGGRCIPLAQQVLRLSLPPFPFPSATRDRGDNAYRTLSLTFYSVMYHIHALPSDLSADTQGAPVHCIREVGS
jgi:hypothetical protein